MDRGLWWRTGSEDALFTDAVRMRAGHEKPETSRRRAVERWPESSPRRDLVLVSHHLYRCCTTGNMPHADALPSFLPQACHYSVWPSRTPNLLSQQCTPARLLILSADSNGLLAKVDAWPNPAIAISEFLCPLCKNSPRVDVSDDIDNCTFGHGREVV